MQSYNQRMIELLKNRQQQEKTRLPKIQRNEAKTRMTMFKKSLRINSTGSASEEREKIKQVGLPLPAFLPNRTFTSWIVSDSLPSHSRGCSVFSAGAEAAEGREAASAAKTREPAEGDDGPVRKQHQGAAAAAGG